LFRSTSGPCESIDSEIDAKVYLSKPSWDYDLENVIKCDWSMVGHLWPRSSAWLRCSINDDVLLGPLQIQCHINYFPYHVRAREGFRDLAIWRSGEREVAFGSVATFPGSKIPSTTYDALIHYYADPSFCSEPECLLSYWSLGLRSR
jgi:hypothetical protein